MTPESLRRTVSDFLAESRAAVVMEDGAVIFDLTEAKYSISGEYNKCLLQFWSHERNVVRRVLDAETKGSSLRLMVQRMGQNRPSKLEIFREQDRRSPSTRKVARSTYENQLHRVLQRDLPDWNVVRLTTNMDLKQSFGPAYTRGLMWRGQSALAVVGVNEQETQATIDAALTCGILWLDACRHRQTGRAVVQGLVLILPKKTSALTRSRMANLHRGAAKWQLYEFCEQEGTLEPMDCADRGNLDTRLVRCTDEASARARFAESIARVFEIFPGCEVGVPSPVEISFRLRGLEFARARVAHDPRSFESGQEIVFGVGAEERVLKPTNEVEFTDLVHLAAGIRRKDGPKTHPLWRMQPERWLESVVIQNLGELDGRLCPEEVYSQVPTFSGADRAMIDVLTVTREGRLALLELKADEDIHLSLQGVDYWSRVTWHQSRGEFAKFGYFPGRELSAEKPLLLLAAPALHVHPATDTILHYLSPEIDWELLGIDERWREQIKVVFRKRASDLRNPGTDRKSA
jgi:hypothetical protein